MITTHQLENRRNLEQAFSTFSEVSDHLTRTYQELEQQVERLTSQLAVANGEIHQQYLEKKALSERLHLVLHTLPAGVLVLDKSLIIVEANPAAQQLLGAPLIGVHWKVLVETRLKQTSATNEFEVRDQQGPTLRRLSIAKTMLDSENKQIVALNDITDAINLREQLQRNQRLSAMGEVASSLAHQLRTPLATALLYSAHLAKPDLSHDQRTQFSDKVLERLRHLERLIQDMLLFVKGKNTTWEVIPLSSLLEELTQVIAPQMQQKDIQLYVTDVSDGAALVGNRKAIGSALLNLLENAMHACFEGGRVEMNARVNGNSVLLSVADNGIGIEPALKDRLFEPFFTTRFDGTGLGLAIVNGVIQSHGGSVAIDSTPGNGSTFTLKLPRRLETTSEFMHAEYENGNCPV
jgi:two-component system, sensor histidine kinase FlrB